MSSTFVRKVSALNAMLAVVSAPAMAHTLWINVVPQADKHVIASLGYGDRMPASEILTPEWGAMTLETYEVLLPSGERGSLGLPKLVTQQKQTVSTGIFVQPDSDVGVRKLSFDARAAKGTYQIAGQTPLVRLTTYRDKQGREQTSEQPLHQLKDVDKVLGTNLEINYMKAVFNVGGWTDPALVGHALEIVPLTDLKGAGVGDVVRFKVLLNGKPLILEGHDAHLAASSAGLGDRWAMQSTLERGEGEFRITQAGLWRVDVTYAGTNKDVDAFRDIEGGKGQALPLSIESTFVFNVLR